MMSKTERGLLNSPWVASSGRHIGSAPLFGWVEEPISIEGRKMQGEGIA
jgi:hypothetical protein